MLDDLIKQAQQIPDYPLASWTPEFKGDMDLVVEANGTWIHQGQPIVKTKIMQLFSRLLQRQNSGDYWLMTPVEAFSITVEDLPFTIVSADQTTVDTVAQWQFTSNCGDQICLLSPNQLQVTLDELGQPQPQLLVRDGLWARISRSVFFQLAMACDTVQTKTGPRAILVSAGVKYDFGAI
ncbi:MAG TPA: hypothetical protein DE045_10395 [Oceanospirillaceae bacterium]|nr:hypothetical protein [Oceanospirillaceae bacterium]